MISFNLSQEFKRAISGLYGDDTFVPPDVSYQEAFPVRVAVLDKMIQPIGTRVWEPVDITDWTIRAAVGRAFLLPVAGTFTLTFTALDASTETTDPIPYNASAEDVEDALNEGAKMIAAGGVVVTGSNGYFVIFFNIAANRSQITGNATGLAPSSFIEVGTVIESETLREVQTIRLMQTPGAYAQLTITSDPSDVEVDVLQVGGGGHNHKVRINLAPLPYDGKWTLTIDGDESSFLAWDISEADLLTALEALESVGAGNVQVVREKLGQYLLMFIGALADTDMGTIDHDGSALLAIIYKSGTLDTRTPGMEMLLGSENEVDAFYEIEGTPPGGTPQKLWKWPVKIIAPVMNGPTVYAPTIEFYTKAEIDELLLSIKDEDDNLLVGSKARFVPLATGFKIQVSTDGVTWSDGPSYEA